MSVRVRKPEVRRVEISRGDWLLLKQHLTMGEYRAHLRRMAREGTPDQVDLLKIGPSCVVAYLVDWSITDADDRPIVIRGQTPDVLAAALEGLEREAYEEIETAVYAHVAQMDRARAEEKKLPTGDPASPSISPSPGSTAGATSGSPSSIATSTP